MVKRLRRAANYLEAAGLSKPDGACMCPHDQVELHRTIATGSGVRQGMLAHPARDPATGCPRRLM
jgi:hypothetical protein